MVMGVNHINLSTNLENPAADTNARVSYPVPFKNESRSPLSNQSQEHYPLRFAGGALLIMNVPGGADLAWYLQQPPDPFARNQSLHSLQHVTVLEAMHTTQHVETLKEPCCS